MFESNEDVTSQAICGIKTKPTFGRFKRRLKGALEHRKSFKSQTKTTLASSYVSDFSRKLMMQDNFNHLI